MRNKVSDENIDVASASARQMPRDCAFELGRLGPKLCLATNQPGGFIEVTGRDTLVYCGEIYQRIP